MSLAIHVSPSSHDPTVLWRITDQQKASSGAKIETAMGGLVPGSRVLEMD